MDIPKSLEKHVLLVDPLWRAKKSLFSVAYVSKRDISP